jgi:hypothetical protein
MWYKESNLKCGLWEAGSSITIMHLLTQHCQLDKSFGKIFNSYPSITHLFTWPFPSHLFSVPWSQNYR